MDENQLEPVLPADYDLMVATVNATGHCLHNMFVNSCTIPDADRAKCNFVKDLEAKYQITPEVVPPKMGELAHEAWCNIVKAAFGPYPQPQKVPGRVPKPVAKAADDEIDSWWNP